MNADSDDPNGTVNAANAWSKAWFDLMGGVAAARDCCSLPDRLLRRRSAEMRDAFFKAMSAQAETVHALARFSLQMMKTSDGQRPGLAGAG